MLKKYASITFVLMTSVLLLAGISLAFASGPSFRPDVTESGKNLSGWHTLGQADWKAENGEYIGTPQSPAGGWLVFDKSYQDIQFYAEYKCTGGCITGLLMRAEKTPDGGMKGVFVPLGGATGDMENLSGYDVTIDAQGKIVSSTQEPRGGGFTRIVSPWPPKPVPPRAGGGSRPGGGRRESTVELPIHPPDTSYHADDWNSVEFSFDANVVRLNLNDGGQRGSEAVEGYGPIALFVGGSGKAEFKNIAIGDLSLKTREPNYTSPDFRKQTLNDFYYGWGQAAGDFNHDGHLDIASGPFIYYGPDFTKRREYFRDEATDPTTDFNMNAHEIFSGNYTGHPEWPDIITVKFGGGHCVYLYVNPQGENRIWKAYPVVDNVSSEVSITADIDGPGKSAVVYAGSDGYVHYAEPDPANPTAPWIVHNVSARGYAVGHGLGAGDINGDGLIDIVNPYGWWEHPKPGNADQTWKYHPEAFAQYSHGFMGGAVMAVYDVNGDGLPDIVTSLAAHAWGLAWFEQKRDAQGNISFVKHMVMDDFSTKNAGGVTFSELHGSGVGDINGDGIPDFITGKRYFSHLDSGLDPYTFGPAVLYWYETVRDPKAPGGARLVPHLIDNDSGVGNTVLAVDLNHSGAVDVVTSTRFGAFIFWNKMHPKKSVHTASASAKPTAPAKR